MILDIRRTLDKPFSETGTTIPDQNDEQNAMITSSGYDVGEYWVSEAEVCVSRFIPITLLRAQQRRYGFR